MGAKEQWLKVLLSLQCSLMKNWGTNNFIFLSFHVLICMNCDFDFDWSDADTATYFSKCWTLRWIFGRIPQVLSPFAWYKEGKAIKWSFFLIENFNLVITKSKAGNLVTRNLLLNTKRRFLKSNLPHDAGSHAFQKKKTEKKGKKKKKKNN